MFPNLSLERWQELGQPQAKDKLVTHTATLLESLLRPDDYVEIISKGEQYIQNML